MKSGHFHHPFHPNKPILCHRTGSSESQHHTNSYCPILLLWDEERAWHGKKQRSPKPPREAWGGKLGVHGSPCGSKEAPGHKN